MNITDIITMIGNLSRSLFSVQHLISGLAYLIGILFFMHAIVRLRKIADARASGGSHEKMFVPLAYLFGGAGLLFLPSAVTALSNTVFGVGNILQYTSYNPYDIMSSMSLIVRTAGMLWFVRGCVLLVHASQPGVQHGPKGLAFLCAGIIAMNFTTTISALNAIFGQLITWTMSFKAGSG